MESKFGMNRIDKIRNTYFLILTATLFGSGLLALFFGWLFEQMARQKLPFDQRTAEIIERDFDGTVCLECSFTSSIVAFFAFGCGVLILLCWAMCETIASIKNRTYS